MFDNSTTYSIQLLGDRSLHEKDGFQQALHHLRRQNVILLSMVTVSIFLVTSCFLQADSTATIIYVFIY